MKPGDLIVKRWGCIEPYQQDATAICLGPYTDHSLLLTGPLIRVIYNGRKVEIHPPKEFEVVSESK